MTAEKMRNLAERRQKQNQERIKNSMERKKSTGFDKIYYVYIIMKIRMQSCRGRRSIIVWHSLNYWIDSKLKKEGFSVSYMYNKMGKVMYSKIGW